MGIEPFDAAPPECFDDLRPELVRKICKMGWECRKVPQGCNRRQLSRPSFQLVNDVLKSVASIRRR